MRTAFVIVALLLSYFKTYSQAHEQKFLIEKILTVDSIKENLIKFSKSKTIVILKNNAFEKADSFNDLEGNVFKILTEGQLYVGGGIQYFLVFDNIEINDSLASMSFHTSSRYLQENYKYIKADLLLKKDKSSNWQVVHHRVRGEECCKW